jgi:hypothetical protein
MRHGKGNFIDRKGDKYIGSWTGDRMHGLGMYIYESGDKYEGEWKNDQKHGYGIFSNPENNERYQGEFKHGYKDGAGEYTFANLDKYNVRQFFFFWLKIGVGGLAGWQKRG